MSHIPYHLHVTMQASVFLSPTSYLMTTQSTLTLVPTTSMDRSMLYCSIVQHSSSAVHTVHTASTYVSILVHSRHSTGTHSSGGTQL